MVIRDGSILVAHPVHCDRENSRAVVYITESNAISTVGVALNKLSSYDMREFMDQKGLEWHGDRSVHIGGVYNPHALIMLHDSYWYSSNTMQVTRNYSISSDKTMLEKMEMGNTPDWYKLFIGCTAWSANELEFELRNRKPRWLFIPNPSDELVQCNSNDMWARAVDEYSQVVFSNYI